MKNFVKWIGITALVAVIGLAFAACGDDDGGEAGPAEPPQTAMYSGAAEDGSIYTLKVIEKTGRYAARDGDDYILYLVKDGITKISNGTVTAAGNVLTLKPSSIEITFTIKIDETGITEIKGTITFSDFTTIIPPIKIDPIEDVPENWPDAERWSGWADTSPINTATLSYTVDKDGVCAVTVGGKGLPPLNDNGGTDGEVRYWNSIWRTKANYAYTAVKGKIYSFTFEAWTDGPDRAMHVEWFWDDVLHLGAEWEPPEDGNWDHYPCPPGVKITSERKTYTLTYYEPKPFTSSKLEYVEFHCANQTGKFYVKMLSIDSF